MLNTIFSKYVETYIPAPLVSESAALPPSPEGATVISKENPVILLSKDSY